MRIEKLELIGFKSFSDRTVFSLHPGITCIVGPNGCGKSNVVDSFKWVLGEQSPKSLRGGKMEEVIFAGSLSKKPRGMADVSLTIAGLARQSDAEDALTTVSRRLFRSGESEYVINKNICRLRDVKDIFLDTGLEVKSYSILEQDRITAILNAKPEDRRFILEEVAGVVKYKVRRNEAQTKLEHSRVNLQRITDILNEVRRQINSLDRQVKKAERFKRLMEELKDTELRISRRDYGALGEELEKAGSSLAVLKEEAGLLKAELSQKEADIQTGRISLVEREKSLQSLHDELSALERMMADLRRAMDVLSTEKESLITHKSRLSVQSEENQKARQETQDRLKSISDAKSTLKSDTESLMALMTEKDSGLKSVEMQLQEKESGLDIMRNAMLEKTGRIGLIKNEINRLSASLDAHKRREDSINVENKELGDYLDSINALYREAESGYAGKNIEVTDLEYLKASLYGEVTQLKQTSEALREETARSREALASSVSRLNSLQELVYNEASDEEIRQRIDVISTISDAMEVPKEYEKAVESALGEAVGGFLVSSLDDIKAGVSAVREKDMSKTAFLTTGMRKHQSDLPEPPAGAVRASDAASVKQEFMDTVSPMLTTILIVKDLDEAFGLPETGYTVVTLDGEVLTPWGAVIAGRNRGILSLKRQIREAHEEITAKTEESETLSKKTADSSARLTQKEAELSSLKDKAVSAEKELSLFKLRAEKHKEDVERTETKIKTLDEELSALISEKQAALSLMEQGRADLAQSELEANTLESQITDSIVVVASGRSELEALRAGFMDIRLSLNTCLERLKSIDSEAASLNRLVSELADKEVLISNEADSTGLKISQRDDAVREKDSELKAVALKAGALTERISSLRTEIAEQSDGLITSEGGLRGLRRSIDELGERVSELEVRRAEYALKMENLETNIKNTYGTILSELPLSEVTEDDIGRVQDIRLKIDALGPVSLGSLDEYEELKKRFEFLSTQKDDLEKSISELEEAIRRINSTTKSKLKEAYEALRVKFAEVYLSLFGGGRAELILTDEANILESGLDIVAQPPGKRLQNISLLSGGEKTLTALALLFASFLIKPTPLCILDEADAALDESNTVKFAQMLRDLSKGIQFVVITHNKVTMEAADFIYGITMEEPGSSKVISMQMAQA